MDEQAQCHYHSTTQGDCRHGSYSPGRVRFYEGDLGRGSGPIYIAVRHEGPREACADPDALPPSVLPCKRECCYATGHTFKRRRPCPVCGVTKATLLKERREAEEEQRKRDERMAASLAKYENELLDEIKTVFRRHGERTPRRAILAAIVEIVKERTEGWDD